MTTERRPLDANPPVSFEPDVQEFWGSLKEIKDLDEDNQFDTTKKRRVVEFDFTDVEVIQSRTPYPFPVFSFRINYSAAAQQPWAVFAESFRLVAPSGERDVYQLEGNRCKFKWDTCILRRQVDGEWTDVESKAWQLTEVSGWGTVDNSVNLDELLVDLADGSNSNDFMQKFYSSADVRGNKGYTTATEEVAKGTLLKRLVDEGKLTQDAEGVYSKA